jgi:polyhydroxybutyrate depolymerase
VRLSATLFLGMTLAACGGNTPPAPQDGGSPTDAGATLDCDAGCDHVPDAGTLDAGVPNDPNGGTADGGACSGSPGDHLRTMYFGGALRTWYEHVPAVYDCTQAAPVVFDFHGYSSNAIEEMALTGVNAKADVANFIALHPEGLGAVQSWNAGACCGDAALLNAHDVDLMRALLANVAQRYNVDARRVYAMGMSNGGFFSHRLACEAADVFAAIAPVAGVMGVPTCTPSRPVPVLDFHGTADPVVPYTGGGLTGFTSVDVTMAGWVQRNGCGANSAVVYQQGDATCRRWPSCSAGADVELCTIDNGGHTWPGGLPIPALGKTSTDVNATDRAWDFFVAHPMP